MIPVPVDPSDPAVLAARDADPVVQRLRALFAPIDWSAVPERDARRPWPGSPPHPRAAYLKVLLIKLNDHLVFITRLRQFLVEHPLVVLEVGFRPVRDPTQPFGFDVEATVPGARWLRQQQRRLDLPALQALFAATVAAVRQALPALGETVAVDVKHILAWVRENNPKQTLAHRFDPTRQPRGDPDCRLGVKTRANGERAAAGKQFVWGYGSGIASATDPVFGDVVIAEWTQPFNHQDITWFHPVYERAAGALGRPPINVTADAAFDAWHVYQRCVATGGLAAIAPNRRGPAPPRDGAGHPICAHGRAMAPLRVIQHEDGYPARVYGCPLRRPVRTGELCAHSRFARGGCTKRINIAPGGEARATLDRSSAAYRALYRQRTSAERINSQAVDFGIERPHVRRLAAVVRLNALTYVLINLRALQRIIARQTGQLPSLC
jgi:hypothetical protein